MRTLLLVTLLLGAALAGCIGDGDGDGGGDPVRTAAAAVDAETGGVQGVVTDVAIAPLTGITMRLVELELETASESDGSFAFSKVPPGVYTLEAVAEGFIPYQETVEVLAGQVETLDLILTEIASTDPYHQIFEFNGFMECAMTMGWNVSGQKDWLFKWSICGDANIVAPNATNDRSYHHFHLAAPIEELVVEGEWDINSVQSDRLEVMVQFGNNGVVIDGAMTMEIELSSSPMHFKLTKEHFEERAQWLKEECENNSASQWCGANPWDNGWDLTFITHPDPECPCVVAQEGFTLYATAFYHEAGPVDWSVVQGRTTG